MKAIFLIRNGVAHKAFKIRELVVPVPGPGEVLIKVEAFGLNFADVMARKGMYKEAPPLPCVLGYDVAGVVAATGKDVTNLKMGDRVTAMTRFGGYAEYAVTDARTTAIISDKLDAAAATAMATQFCTAYFAAAEMVTLFPGDKVLVHSGAGGVGTALIQYAKYKHCEIFATAGSLEKLDYLRKTGVTHAINYNTHDFEKQIKKITNGKGLDVIFDAVGGKSVMKGFRSLAAAGRIICYGAAEMSDKNILGKIKTALNFGIYHPVELLMASKAIIGINMLRVADSHPHVLQRCLNSVVKLTEEGIFTPATGKVFPVSEISAAHEYMEKRKSIGKVAVTW